jgi:hypothetical protein
MIKRLAVAALVAAATFAAVAEARTLHLRNVHGRLTPVVQDDTEHGLFRMKRLRGRGDTQAERIEAFARGLDMSGDAPSFHVFLVKSDGTGAADFGAMRVNRRGNGAFLFDTRRGTMPDGVTTIVDYVGGVVEVRDAGGTAVCSGVVPQFDVIVGDASSRLTAVADGATVGGKVSVRRMATPRGIREDLRIECRGLTGGAEYTAVAIAADTTETQIGVFTARSNGNGGLRLADAAIPGGGVMGLAGQTLEIRDANGDVLTGTMPTIDP